MQDKSHSPLIGTGVGAGQTEDMKFELISLEPVRPP